MNIKWVEKITKNNVNELDNLWNKDIKLYLISCNTWKYKDGIAQSLSNNLGVNVYAPDNYITTNIRPPLYSIANIPFLLFSIAWYKPWVPTVFWDWKFNKFTPNN